MITTVKNISQLQIEDLSVTKIIYAEMQISLCFQKTKQLDINDFWELYEDNVGIIDKGVSLKFRDKLMLYRLIGKKCLKIIKADKFLEILFSDGLRLVIHRGRSLNVI